jgi:Zn ribbon nucleic-acid-binding protein
MVAKPAGHIVVECLHCGHCARLLESRLPDYGVPAGAPIASFVQRLTCVECGHHSVRAYRPAEAAADTRVP